jgi:micrococcal nuclease
VLDDDTIVADGIHDRLKGMAKPQVAHHQDPGKPVGEAAKAFMVDLIEGQVVVRDLAQDSTHGRRVGWCSRNGRDVAAELIGAGLARDSPRYSGGRASVEQPAAKAMPCRSIVTRSTPARPGGPV